MIDALNQVPVWILYFYIFLFGICIGSFLNVVILRGLKDEEIVFTRSHCPVCKKTLKWYMNIPLFSYIFLRGKCAFCKCKISVQYPIVEFLNGFLYVISFYFFGFSLKALFICIMLSLFIVLAVTDIIEMVIITIHTYILAIVGIIYALLKLSSISFLESILCAIAGFILFEAVSRLGYLFAKMRIFGEGDSYIVLALGAIFGFKALFLIIILSLLIQCVFSLPIITYSSFKQKKNKLGLSYILVFVSIFYILFANITNFVQTNFYTTSVIALVVIMLYSLKNIIKEINLKKENIKEDFDENNNEDFEEGKKIFLFLPFGPALIISATICIFYLPQIKNIIKTFLY